jgi:type IV secretion system protein TrbJ
MRRRWLVATVVAVVSLSLVHPVFAIFGFGDIVFDPSVFAQAVQQVVRLEQQYIQLVETYQMIQKQYEHLKWMAKRVPVDMAARYRAAMAPWQNSSATSTYGTTDAWLTGINTGVDASAGYAAAVQRLGTYGEAFGNIPADQQARVRTEYGTVELTDGANIEAIETIGRLRANARAVEAAIQGLETDSLSGDPDMNTEIAVLNKINAANLIQIHSAQDTNKLLVALAEEQVIDAKRKRDAEARAINNDIRFRNEGKALLDAQVADASAAMRSWRMP